MVTALPVQSVAFASAIAMALLIQVIKSISEKAILFPIVLNWRSLLNVINSAKDAER